MKQSLFALLVLVLFTVLPIACSKEGGGAGSCTTSCGVVGLTTITSKTVLSSEENCRKMAAESTRKDCRYGYCPPTGNQDDCIEIN